MVNYKFDFENINVSLTSSIEKSLEEERKKILDGRGDYKALSLFNDLSVEDNCRKVFDKIKSCRVVVLIGIGGSNLAPLSVAKAIGGEFYRDVLEREFFFLDTTDSTHSTRVKEKLKKYKEEGKEICYILISKSGTTIESLANFLFLFNNKKELDEISKNVVVITQRETPLWKEGEKRNYNLLEIDKDVGGRFSAFSSVGILPLMLMGLSVERFRKGAELAFNDVVDKKINKSNPALNSTLAIFKNYNEERNILDTMYFSPNLDELGAWKRQLIAESLGKNGNGITPIVSIGSTDLHSMGQLYLGGRDDKVHEIVDFKVKENGFIGDGMENINNLAGLSLSYLKDSLRKGIEGAYKNSKLPFYSIEFDTLNETSIGYYMQMKLVEVVYLGKLLGINPFGQPNVEEYKKIAKERIFGEIK